MPAGTSESKARFEELQTQIKTAALENDKLSEANLALQKKFDRLKEDHSRLKTIDISQFKRYSQELLDELSKERQKSELLAKYKARAERPNDNQATVDKMGRELQERKSQLEQLKKAYHALQKEIELKLRPQLEGLKSKKDTEMKVDQPQVDFAAV